MVFKNLFKKKEDTPSVVNTQPPDKVSEVKTYKPISKAKKMRIISEKNELSRCGDDYSMCLESIRVRAEGGYINCFLKIQDEGSFNYCLKQLKKDEFDVKRSSKIGGVFVIEVLW